MNAEKPTGEGPFIIEYNLKSLNGQWLSLKGVFSSLECFDAFEDRNKYLFDKKGIKWEPIEITKIERENKSKQA